MPCKRHEIVAVESDQRTIWVCDICFATFKEIKANEDDRGTTAVLYAD